MVLGITVGDASGVGPEILLRAWLDGALPKGSVVFGDAEVLRYCAGVLHRQVTVRAVRRCEDAVPDALNVYDLGLLRRDEITPGRLSCAAGRAALIYLKKALEEALAGRIRAIVTLPMNKEATRLSDPGFTGHTDVIAEACGRRDYSMTLVSDRLIAAHVSSHVPLRVAIESLAAVRIETVIAVTAALLARLGRAGPIGVLGLNPHAGEAGAFGTEERDHIEPAIAAARARGIDAVGPLPPDTAFMRTLKGEFRAVVCMYHDQGHIALKTIGMEEAVNVTAGLPIVRTSVDHGTAFDIAYKGVASTGSFVRACRLAQQLASAP